MSSRKKLPVTLIFAGVVALLVAFSLFDFRRAKNREQLEDGETKLIDLKAGDMTAVTIKSPTQTIEVKKTGDDWKILQPIQDDTDELMINALLKSLDAAKAKKLSTEGTVDWAKFGLVPGVEIQVKGAKSSDGFTLSDSSAFDGSFYMRKGDGLYLGDRSWAHFADKQVNTVRSHMVWRGEDTIAQVDLQTVVTGKPGRSSDPNVTVQKILKKDKDWVVEPTMDLPLNADKVSHWLQAVHDLKAADFVTDNPTDKDREIYLLKKPVMKLDFYVLKAGKTEHVHWTIGQPKANDVYIETDGRPQIFKMSTFALRDVQISVGQLLDIDPKFKIPIEEITSVNLLRDGKPMTFSKTGGDWKMNGGPMKPDGLAEFLQKLRDFDLGAGDMPPDTKFDGKNTLLIQAKDKVLLNLEWTKAEGGKKPDLIRWVKLDGIKERFKVNAARLRSLLQTDFNPPPPGNDGSKDKTGQKMEMHP